MEAQACSGCGKPISGSEILYTEDARVVCAACEGKADIVATDKRAAGNIVKAAWSSVGSGLVALGASAAMLGIITWLLVAMAFVPAIFAMSSLASGNERFTQHLSPGQRTGAWVCAVVGIALAALALMGAPRLFIG